MIEAIEIDSYPLVKYQKDYLYNRHRFTVTEACTKSGKTASHIWWQVEQWHTPEDSAPIGWEVWWVAPIYKQARIAFDRVRKKFGRLPGYRVNISDMTLINPMGRVWRFLSADNPDSLYGENVLAIVFDEYTRAKKEAFFALRSTITKTGGKMKLIGNYIGEANWGHQLALEHADDPEWAYFKIDCWQAVEAGILDRKEVEQAQRDLDPWDFKALYECTGSAHPRQLINADAINDLFINDHIEGGKSYISADIAGEGRDKTVIMVWDGFREEETITMETNTPEQIRQAIKDLSAKYGVTRRNVVVDANGLGWSIAKDLNAKPFINNAAQIKLKGHNYASLKDQCYYAAKNKIEAGGMYLKSNRKDVALELEAIRRVKDITDGKMKIEGKDKIKESIGRSPDYADAIAMRMVFELTPEGWAAIYTK